MSKAEVKKQNKHFGGWNKQFTHQSETLGCSMNFTVYFPPAAEGGKVPVIYFLSGLTCTDENFIQKAGAQRKAAELGIALIAPDTSPRGLNMPGEKDSWDFGEGAGFYLNATQQQWKQYRMYDYIVSELPALLRSFPELDLDNASIMGHSMGGHGALVIALRNPDTYKTVSAFAPIANPVNVPWGQKAFSGYLGDDKESWKQYDATELVKAYQGSQRDVLIDQGTSDDFYEKQLKPEVFREAATGTNVNVTLRLQDGYDHSYFTIATFIDDHIEHAAKALKA